MRQKEEKSLYIAVNLNGFEKNIFEFFCKKLMFRVEKVSKNKKGRMYKQGSEQVFYSNYTNKMPRFMNGYARGRVTC